MNKNKKKIVLGSIIGVFIGILISVSYAFFTFSKTSLNSQLVAGDIYMQYKETNSINIPDMMPRSTYVDNENGYFEFQITGKNTYTEKDIIYDVVLSYGDTPTDPNRTIRIKDELLRFRLVKVVNNEEQEIFTDRSYVSINNTRIHKETIPAETNTEITTTYRIYAWIGSETKIGNTEDADYSLSDWNKVFASIKVNVTGDFQEKKVPEPLYDILKTGAVDDSNIDGNGKFIKFYEVNGTDNGNGKFVRHNTISDTNPIYYYRGNVDNNNVVFANKCWKMVRTTETGGTKLVYNGEMSDSYSPSVTTTEYQDTYHVVTNTAGFTFNSSDKSWNVNISTQGSYEFSFTIDNKFDLPLILTGNGGRQSQITIYDNETIISQTTVGLRVNKSIQLENLSSSSVIKIEIVASSNVSSSNLKLKVQMMKSTTTPGEYLGTGCFGNNANNISAFFQESLEFDSFEVIKVSQSFAI